MKNFTRTTTNRLHKRFLSLFISLIISFCGFSQNVGISPTGTAPNASAGLDVDFATKGLLLPRVALTGAANNTALNPIIAPVAGMVVYNTATILDVAPGIYYNNGTKWLTCLPKVPAATGIQYWDGTTWVTITDGTVGQKLQLSNLLVPTWVP